MVILDDWLSSALTHHDMGSGARPKEEDPDVFASRTQIFPKVRVTIGVSCLVKAGANE